MEDNFSTGRAGSGMVLNQAHYLQAHLLLCSRVPSRLDLYQSAAQRLGTSALCALQESYLLLPQPLSVF